MAKKRLPLPRRFNVAMTEKAYGCQGCRQETRVGDSMGHVCSLLPRKPVWPYHRRNRARLIQQRRRGRK